MSTDELLRIIRAGATRPQIAKAYGTALFQPEAVDWVAINAAILERYTLSGLKHIKNLAWRTRVRPPGGEKG